MSSLPSTETTLPAPAEPRGVSLIVPAHGSAAAVAARVAVEWGAVLARACGRYEILVVGSGTGDDADAIHPAVRVVQCSGEAGIGAAVRAAVPLAHYDAVAVAEIEGGVDLASLAYMRPLLDHYDIVCGDRIERPEGWAERIGSAIAGVLCRSLLGITARDIACPLKLFRRRSLAAILPEADDELASVEILSRAHRAGQSVVEVGVKRHSHRRECCRPTLPQRVRAISAIVPFWWSRELFPAANPTAARDGFWGWLCVLALVAGALLFPRLSYPLIEPDESRVAEIAREMLASGDWVTPRLNGEPYFDKPPLFYWLCAASYRIFGVSDGAARLLPALAAFLTILALYVGGRRIVGTRPAFLAGLTLCLMLGFIYCGRFVILDSLLCLWMTLALLLAFEAIRGDRLRLEWWFASAFFCGLALMTKGPVALALLAPVVVGYCWLSRSSATPRTPHWGIFLIIIAAVALPWYVAMVVGHAGFGWEFFFEHNIGRFLAGSNHPQPFWFFVPVIAVSCLPWSLFLIPLGRFLFARSERLRRLRSASLGFPLLWSGWCVLFFSLSRGKLPTYILPALPALALLLGAYFEQFLFHPRRAVLFWRERRAMLPQWGTSILCGAGVVVVAGAWLLGLRGTLSCARDLALWSAALVAMTVYARRTPAMVAWTLCGAAAFWAAHQSIYDLVPAWARNRALLANVAPAEDVAAALRDPRTAVGCWNGSWKSVLFYLGRDNVRHLHGRDDAEIADFIRAHDRTLLILNPTADLSTVTNLCPLLTDDHQVIDKGIHGRRRSVFSGARFVLVQHAPDRD